MRHPTKMLRYQKMPLGLKAQPKLACLLACSLERCTLWKDVFVLSMPECRGEGVSFSRDAVVVAVEKDGKDQNAVERAESEGRRGWASIAGNGRRSRGSC